MHGRQWTSSLHRLKHQLLQLSNTHKPQLPTHNECEQRAEQAQRNLRTIEMIRVGMRFTEYDLWSRYWQNCSSSWQSVWNGRCEGERHYCGIFTTRDGGSEWSCELSFTIKGKCLNCCENKAQKIKCIFSAATATTTTGQKGPNCQLTTSFVWSGVIIWSFEI